VWPVKKNKNKNKNNKMSSNMKSVPDLKIQFSGHIKYEEQQCGSSHLATQRLTSSTNNAKMKSSAAIVNLRPIYSMVSIVRKRPKTQQKMC